MVNIQQCFKAVRRHPGVNGHCQLVDTDRPVFGHMRQPFGHVVAAAANHLSEQGRIVPTPQRISTFDGCGVLVPEMLEEATTPSPSNRLESWSPSIAEARRKSWQRIG